MLRGLLIFPTLLRDLGAGGGAGGAPSFQAGIWHGVTVRLAQL